ncbi:MAG: site-specific integrase, partial [Acidimicrobiia bacterium]
HHYASIILDGGVSIRALSEYLGHASAKTTLDIYAHLMPDTEDRARQVVDRALGESSLNEDTGIV